MGLLYETVEETQTRLYETVFLYKDQPVLCQGVSCDEDGGENPEGINLSLLFYPRCVETASVKLNDPDLNYRNYNLGYCNLNRGASFIYRVPTRSGYKQGLCRNNLGISKITPSIGVPEFRSIVTSIGFRDMLRGVYPTLSEAASRLEADDAPVSVAFHKNFALMFDKFRKDYLLYYKGDRVAFGTSSAFDLPAEFRYLREIITQSGIKVR